MSILLTYALPTFGAWPKIMSYEAWASIELNTPESEEAHKLWAEADTRLLLPNLTLGASESSDYARIMNDVNTAIAENFVKFIIGTRPISEVPDLVKQCKDMGIEKAMSYYQSAYDRYMSK
jgi:putative aldouronate transport system substrate-binding protein